MEKILHKNDLSKFIKTLFKTIDNPTFKQFKQKDNTYNIEVYVGYVDLDFSSLNKLKKFVKTKNINVYIEPDLYCYDIALLFTLDTKIKGLKEIIV